MHFNFNVYANVKYVYEAIAYDADSVDDVAVSVDLKGLDFWVAFFVSLLYCSSIDLVNEYPLTWLLFAPK